MMKLSPSDKVVSKW